MLSVVSGTVNGVNGNLIRDEYFTREEVAQELGISLRTLDRWHALRIGPSRTKFRRLILYKKQTVLDWLSKHEEPSPFESRGNR